MVCRVDLSNIPPAESVQSFYEQIGRHVVETRTEGQIEVIRSVHDSRLPQSLIADRDKAEELLSRERPPAEKEVRQASIQHCPHCGY